MGLDVAGQNIANINTPGYTRRTLVLAEVPPTDPLSAGRGVTVVAIRAMRDRVRRRAPASRAGRHGLRRGDGRGARDGRRPSSGLPGSSLDAQLTAFFDAFSTLANDPTLGRGARQRRAAGRAAGAGFHGHGRPARRRCRRDADSSIRARRRTKSTGSAAELASAERGHRAPAATTRNRFAIGRASFSSRLGELADVAVLARADGGVDVTLASGPRDRHRRERVRAARPRRRAWRPCRSAASTSPRN